MVIADDGSHVAVSVFKLLDDEWRHLRSDRLAAHRLQEVCARAGGAKSLGELEQYVRRAGPADADRVLLALVSRAVAADELAARTLLQLLLPGTRNLARRWWALGDEQERAAAAVTAVYQRIRSYPLARRPGRVAANILMDAARELRRAVPRLISTPSPDPLVDEDAPALDQVASAHAAAELAEVLLDAVDDGVIGGDDAELIARSRIAGDRVADIAAHRKVGCRTLWHRRQRAELTLVAAHSGGR